MFFTILPKINSFPTSNQNVYKANARLKSMNYQYVLKIAFTAVIRPQAKKPKKTKKQEHKGAKETKEEKRISPENRLKK